MKKGWYWALYDYFILVDILSYIPDYILAVDTENAHDSKV